MTYNFALAVLLAASITLTTAASAQTPPSAANGLKIVLVALGDSITRSNGASNGCLGNILVEQPALMNWITLYQNATGNVGFARRTAPCGGNGWVDRLASMLQADGNVEVVNASSVGATVEAVETYETGAIPQDATLVVIAVGTPDEMRIATGKETIDDFKSDFSEMVETVRTKAPLAKTFIALLPDLSKLPVMPAGTGPNPVTAANPQNVADGTVARYLRVHTEINAFLQHLNAMVINPYCAPDFYQQISSDGFHPNDAGHQIVAQSFYASIHGQTPCRSRPKE